MIFPLVRGLSNPWEASVSLSVHRSLFLLILAAALAAPNAMQAATPHRTGDLEQATAVDRDGDGEVGEAWAIRERVKLYRELHGENGVLTP